MKFICAICDEKCESTRPDEEAQKEFEETFGEDAVDPGLVCDECYKTFMKSISN